MISQKHHVIVRFSKSKKDQGETEEKERKSKERLWFRFHAIMEEQDRGSQRGYVVADNK